ncbi:MAG: D-alanyl-D-alanine carboxypeptidase/D-alanyl-D-alanine-endopeptidase [Polyangiaceae bacterium]
MRRFGVLLACLAASGLLGPPAARAEPASRPKLESASRSGTAQAAESLARWVQKEHGELSLLVVELPSRQVLADKNAALALNPASNAKVLTAAAALSKLGADYRFKSGLYGALEGGSVDRLVLRSNGDPSLGAKDFEKLVKDLTDRGLKRVGEVLVDQSAFDDHFVPPAFEQQPNEWAPFRAPVAAVSVDENAFVVRVLPGAAVGEPAKVSIDPPGFVTLENKVTTDKKGKSRRLQVELRPADRALTLRISGQISLADKGTAFAKRVDDPRHYAGHVLRAILQRQGVVVDGGVREGGKSESRVLSERKSEPLSSLVRELGKNSDNFYAEMLLKAIGAESGKRPGSSADGAAEVLQWMKSQKAVDSGTRVVNGSGLFDANRVSAWSLVAALAAARDDPKVGKPFLDQLAEGGVDGTLKHRFRSARTRKVRAKTGTLARAHSLAGYILGADGQPRIAFAILLNGIAGKADEQRRGIDRVVERARAELAKSEQNSEAARR